MPAFRSSDNKRVIRRKWDLPIIRARSKTLGRGLTYLGMPGSNIEDLLDWRDCLDRIRTGVERNRHGEWYELDKLMQSQILTNVADEGELFSSGFELRKGDIEDLIIYGVDNDGIKPQLGDGYSDGYFTYDLANLDFCGGMGYKGKSKHAKRVKAIRKLAERQQGTNFILLLTYNVRDKMENEVVQYLQSTQDRHRRNRALQATLNWYANLGRGKQAFVLKAAVPLFVQQEFEIFGFQVFCFPPLMYEGTGDGSRLVHFVFDARHKSGSNLPVVSEQHPDDLVNLPMMEVVNQKIQIAAEQHPNFDFSICKTCLSFLDSETRKGIFRPKSK